MISKHISNKEAWGSPTAKRYGIDNKPNTEQLRKMTLVALKIFEPVREHFKVPIKIESFFRSDKLNKKIGGAKYSQHKKGEAIDIDNDYGNITNTEMFYWIIDNLDFDQIIFESWDGYNDAGWIHCSYKEVGNRNKISIMYRKNKRTYYKHFYKLSEFILFKEQLYN